SSFAEVAAARRASPAVTARSIVCSRGTSSSKGCETSSSARLTRILYTTWAVPGKEACVADCPSITDDGVARLRARIGVPQPHPQPPHYRCPNEDAFRLVAESYGDDNPLWCDPAYAAATRWHGPLAPPPLVGVHDKRSEFAERAVHEWTAEAFAAPGEVLSAQYRLMIRTERGKAEKRGKYDETSIDPYTDEQLRRIDDDYASEPARRRGAEPRWWEDVEEGDEIGPLVKGPLRVTDMVCWHVGMGMGLYGVKALRLGYQQRRRVPRFFRPDDLNIPHVQQRVPWDPQWARRAGNPSIYDYGRMRETWLIHLCTDWMGDDAWLWKLDCQFRRFNYVGDTHWMRGRVVHKTLVDG